MFVSATGHAVAHKAACQTENCTGVAWVLSLLLLVHLLLVMRRGYLLRVADQQRVSFLHAAFSVQQLKFSTTYPNSIHYQPAAVTIASVAAAGDRFGVGVFGRAGSTAAVATLSAALLHKGVSQTAKAFNKGVDVIDTHT